MDSVCQRFLDSVLAHTCIDETSQRYQDLKSLFMDYTLEEFQRDASRERNRRGQPFGNLENKLVDILAEIYNYDGTEMTSSVVCSLMCSLGYTYYNENSSRWKNKMGNLRQQRRKMVERRNEANRRREEQQNNAERELPLTEFLQPQPQPDELFLDHNQQHQQQHHNQQQQPDGLFLDHNQQQQYPQQQPNHSIPGSPQSELCKQITLPSFPPLDDMQLSITPDSTSPRSLRQLQSPRYDYSPPSSPTNYVDRIYTPSIHSSFSYPITSPDSQPILDYFTININFDD